MPTTPADPSDAQTRAEQTGTGRKKQVVILGGGFAGAYCARTLARSLGRRGMRDVEIIVLDRHNYFIFYPLLVEAGTGSVQPSHTVVGIRSFIPRGVRFVMADVKSIDFARRRVAYAITGQPDPEDRCFAEYDHLVLAPGTVTLMPDIPGLREHAYEMKSLAQAIALRDRAVQLLEWASAIDNLDKRRSLLHWVIVGGSFTGIETAGEFEQYLRTACRRRYPRLDPADVRVTVVDRSDRILKVLDERLSEWSTRHLHRRPIDLRLNAEVARIAEDHVMLKGGERLDAYTLVWCAGIAPNPLIASLGLPVNPYGYVLCERDGRVQGHANVWALGDAAVNPDADGDAYPATAQAAVGGGIRCGKNIAAVLGGRPTKPIDLLNKGQLAAFGRFDAVAQVFGMRFTGVIAWFMWRTVYLMKMPGVGRKLRVAVDWTLDLVSRRDYVEAGIHRLVRAAPVAASRQESPGAPHAPGDPHIPPAIPEQSQPRDPDDHTTRPADPRQVPDARSAIVDV